MKSRLNVITSMIESEYKEIWDTCCDHGKLGISLIKNTNKSLVHFVDCIPSIIDKLKNTLEVKGLLENPRVELHTKFAQDIRLGNNRSLICICGVGSETAIDIITGLLKNNDLTKHDIILSVQYKTPKLRKYLKECGFKLQKEVLCFEGKWGHEIMRISLNSGDEINIVGKSMFKNPTKKHNLYLKKSIIHYKKKSLINDSYLEILNQYTSI